ncbi:hypothetical protein L1871_17850 [Aeromonas caviae]|uniref:hypothetical protein n=1 Tax=Aeromonas caviae TaxID=648 RepID=UPI001F1C2A6F|nr:hypothetical protein [Aeromonas caviae]UJQ36179.1 hypothetical protein L1871_17850 [Aeromonas caviae]
MTTSNSQKLICSKGLKKDRSAAEALKRRQQKRNEIKLRQQKRNEIKLRQLARQYGIDHKEMQ